MSTETREAMTAERMREIRERAQRCANLAPPAVPAFVLAGEDVPALLFALEEARAERDLGVKLLADTGSKYARTVAEHAAAIEQWHKDQASMDEQADLIIDLGRERDALAARVAELEGALHQVELQVSSNEGEPDDVLANIGRMVRPLLPEFKTAPAPASRDTCPVDGHPCEGQGTIADCKAWCPPAAPPEKAPAPTALEGCTGRDFGGTTGATTHAAPAADPLCARDLGDGRKCGHPLSEHSEDSGPFGKSGCAHKPPVGSVNSSGCPIDFCPCVGFVQPGKPCDCGRPADHADEPDCYQTRPPAPSGVVDHGTEGEPARVCGTCACWDPPAHDGWWPCPHYGPRRATDTCEKWRARSGGSTTEGGWR